MSPKIELGYNYLYFPKAGYTGGKVTGMTMVECLFVGTRDYLFLVPVVETSHIFIASQVRTFRFGDGLTIRQGIDQLLADPALTVEQLEKTLVEMLGADNHDRVIAVAQLEKFSCLLLGPLSQARLKHKAGGATKVVTCYGKGAMKQFKAFYFPKGS